MPAPRFFASPLEFREWLHANHRLETELIVGYHKVGSGRPSMTWSESVDEALCYGWIDGVRRSIDEGRYSIRFTPRKARSIWSRVNMAKVATLVAEGRMQPAGLAAWELRTEERSGIYSFENEQVELDPELERRFRKDAKAWSFFQAQPPGYRKQVLSRVMSPKRADTRERRFVALLEHSSRGERLL